jgi:hypothetical protein
MLGTLYGLHALLQASQQALKVRQFCAHIVQHGIQRKMVTKDGGGYGNPRSGSCVLIH